MGMRGTGSNSVVLENVFVPGESVGARRPRGTFHLLFGVITTVACPIIMSAYVGIAEAAASPIHWGRWRTNWPPRSWPWTP